MPNIGSEELKNLSKNLSVDKEWHFKRKSRQFDEKDEFSDLEQYISYLKSHTEKSWWGAISRYVTVDEVDKEQVEHNVIKTTEMFGPYVMKIAKNLAGLDSDVSTEENYCLQDLFINFMKKFPEVSKLPFATDKDLWRIMSNARQLIQNVISTVDKESKIVVKHSVGKGSWARVPWFAFLHKDETSTTESGIYGCYLFAEDMSGVYLCLGLGVTEFNKKYSRSEVYSRLKDQSNSLVSNLKLYKAMDFQKKPLTLNPLQI